MQVRRVWEPFAICCSSMLVRPDVERPDRPNPAQMLLMHLAWSVIRAMEGHTYMHNTICDSSVYLRSCLPSNLCINLPMISLLVLSLPPSCMPACMYTYHTYIYIYMYVCVCVCTHRYVCFVYMRKQSAGFNLAPGPSQRGRGDSPS